MTWLRPLIIFAGLLAVWQIIIWATGVPFFILPSPGQVGMAILEHADSLLENGLVTLSEILGGLALGILLGTISALTMAFFRPARQWLMPVLVVSQAVPVFTVAPVLVLWIGFGIGSKVAMATLIIFFPVTAALFDGLRRTDPGYLDLARTMNASRWAVMRHIRIPAALPAFASGLRVATAVAPIGAVVGEWVGASQGLGTLMLHANGRSQTDVMFAALFVLSVISVLLYFSVDRLLWRLLAWSPNSLSSND